MRLCIVALGIIIANPSYATYIDGNKMNNYCLNKKATFENTFLMGYISGVVDAEIARTASVDMVGKFKAFCLPDGIELGKLVDISCAIPEKHPNMRGVGANYLITFAIGQVWPCPKATAKPKP